MTFVRSILATAAACCAALVFSAPAAAQTTPAPLPAFPKASTALLIVDPYNDFLSEDGKLWPYTKAIAESVGLVDHMKQALAAARAHGLKVFIVPHRRYQSGDWADAKNLPYRMSLAQIEHMQLFAKGSKGGEFRAEFMPQRGDVVVNEHWISSGFAGTDLDIRLKQNGIDHIVLVGMRANTCIESTLREGAERGYHTTVVTDAIAAFSPVEMKASLEVNYPNYAQALLTADQFVAALGASPR